MHRLMSLFWATGGRLVEVKAWATKDAAIAEDEAPIHPAESLSFSAWLQLTEARRRAIVNEYSGPRRTYGQRAA